MLPFCQNPLIYAKDFDRNKPERRMDMKFKRILCIFTLVCIMCTLCGCVGKKPVAPITKNEISFVEVLIGDEYNDEWCVNGNRTSVVWQKLRLTEEHGQEYPALSAAFEEYNNEGNTDAEGFIEEYGYISEEMESDKYYPRGCEAETKLYLQRADNHMVSLLESVYQYTGGVHPDYFVNGVNFNTQTGEKAVLSNVLTDTKELPDILSKKITEKYSDVAFGDLKEIFSQYKPEDYTWTVDYQGITFWFSPYEIAAYAVGTLSARIWFDEMPDMFEKKYTGAPGKYVQTLPMGLEFEFDLNEGDGARDVIYTEKMPDQYGSYYMLSVCVNGQTGTDEINYGYDFDAYLIHMNDKNYIYSDSFSDNDYHMFCTWDINGTTPEVTDMLSGTEMDSEYIEEGFEYGTVYKSAFNNPEAFRLETRFVILGTRGGIATYKVSETDGKPEMTDEAYNLYGNEIKTVVSLEAELLPDMEKTQLPPGTVLYPYQTDGESFVDLKTEDDEVLRIYIEKYEWQMSINGIPEDECFEGLMYAG